MDVHAHFTPLDWSVTVAYLAFSTAVGYLMRGKQATIRDFFLGGRKLPWPAVCGSIIATEISAVTFISVPAIAFAAGGDMTYLQLALGSILARFLIGWFMVPAYYEREIYSPYEYMGIKLGPAVHRLTTVLFSVGAVLGQGVRVFTTALVLRVITGIDLVTSIWIIGVVAVAWTLMGGITTVIWTDVVQFLVFVLGGLFALVTVITKVDGGLVQLITEGAAAGKLRVLNATLDPAEAYTLWAGIFGSTFLTLASHGTDQMMAQRIFCCRGPREARKAIVWSSLGILITVLMLFLGVALHSYHGQHPLSEAGADLVAHDRNNVFPVFIVESLPPGITGLVIAAIFAAAISSLDSALAALSQTSVNSFYRPLVRPGAPDRHYVKTGHAFTVLWSLALCGMAVACIELKSDERFENLVDLALGMTSYTYGALLGCFLMAFLPFHRDGRGLLVGVPCAMLTVFALTWHAPVPQQITLYAAIGVLLGAAWMLRHELMKLPIVTGVLAATLVASRLRVGGSPEAPDHLRLAWPWMYPIGLGITLLLGWSLGRPTTGDEPVRLRG